MTRVSILTWADPCWTAAASKSPATHGYSVTFMKRFHWIGWIALPWKGPLVFLDSWNEKIRLMMIAISLSLSLSLSVVRRGKSQVQSSGEDKDEAPLGWRGRFWSSDWVWIGETGLPRHYSQPGVQQKPFVTKYMTAILPNHKLC